MSELINTHDNRATIRWKLLTGASALALTVYGTSVNVAKAEDANQPSIWIELDSQFARQQASNEAFLPPFLFRSQFDGASEIGRMPQSVWDDGAKISFQPAESDWVFSAAIRYGKISRHASQIQLTTHPTPKYPNINYIAYQNWKAKSSESHTILDFQAGKDVGIGKFGSGSSLFSVGVRYVKFNSQSSSDMQSQPTNHVSHDYGIHKFSASFAAARKFSGLGPSLSWNASAEIAGNPSSSDITLDWGVNGAVLFGRQRMQGQHQVLDRYFIFLPYVDDRQHITVNYQISASPARSKRVTVPNLGGFAGFSWRTSNAKISLGYRADMFFGAIDGGIDATKKENRGFYGPYASISIGIGD